MSESGVRSPSRSTGAVRRSRLRSSRSLRSNTSNSSTRLSELVEDCVISRRMSVLSDNTNIDQPMNKSWWKKLDDTSIEYLHESNQPNENVDIENILDISIVSLEKKSKSTQSVQIDSSDNESIKSIVVPRRNFFASKKRELPNRSNPFKQFLIATLDDTSTDESLLVVTKKLFHKPNEKKGAILPSDLLAASPDESTEIVLPDKPKTLFSKRQIPIKKLFADNQFSESEDERTELHPKVLSIKNEEKNNRQSLDEWQNLPSSTLMENQLIQHMSIDTAENENIAEDETPNIVVSDQEKKNQQINSNNFILSSSVTQKLLKNNHVKTQDNVYDMQEIQLENEDELEETYVEQLEVEHELDEIAEIDHKVEDKQENFNKINQEVNEQENFNKINQEVNEQEEMGEISQEVVKEQEKINEINLQVEDVQDEMDKMDDQVENQQEKIDYSNLHVEDKRGEIDEVDQVVDNQQKKIDDLNLHVEDDQGKMDEIDHEVQKQQKTIDRINLQVEGELKKTNESRQEIQNKLDNMNVSQSTSENDQDDINESHQEIEDNQEDMNESLSEIENDQDDMNESNSEIDDELERNTSQLEVEDEEGEMKESQSEFEDDQDEIDENQSEAEDDQDETNNIQLKVKNFQEELGESQQQEYEENLNQNRKSQQKKNFDKIEKTKEDIVASEPDGQEQEDYDDQLIEPLVNGTVDIKNKTDKSLKSPEIILNSATNATGTNRNNSFFTNRNTSKRKTKSVRLTLFKSGLLPARESTDFDISPNTTGDGSGWDSHRTTRKTLRQTFGKDFSPRKSLRTLVLEKEYKRKTYENNVEATSKTTEIPAMFDKDEEIDHEVDRLKQAELNMFLDKFKNDIMERNRQIEEKARNSVQTNPVSNFYNTFKMPTRPAVKKRKANTKPQIKYKKFRPLTIPETDLPEEFLEDLKYKPPKRYKPRNASWITKRLYNYLEKQLEPNYSYKARVRAEELVQQLHEWVTSLRRCDVAPADGVELVARKLARLGFVTTYFDFYNFIKEYLPREIKVKVVPDILNQIPKPSGGVFSNILDSNT